MMMQEGGGRSDKCGVNTASRVKYLSRNHVLLPCAFDLIA